MSAVRTVPPLRLLAWLTGTVLGLTLLVRGELAVLMLLAASAAFLTWRVEIATSRARVLASVVAATAFLFLSAFVWTVFLLVETAAGECTYVEVQCSQRAERLAAHGWIGYPLLLAVAVTAGVLLARPPRSP